MRAFDFADEGRPRLACQDFAAVDDHQLIAPDDRAAVVHRADAVGVAVEGDAEVGLGLAHLVDQRLEVFGHGRVGMMIGEPAIHFEKHFGGIHVQVFEKAVHYRTARAVARVEDHADAARKVELRGDFRHVRGDRIRRGFRAFAGDQIAAVDHPADFLYGRAMDCGGAAHGFETVELAGIVTAGNHHGAVGLQMEDRIVEHGGGHHAYIDHVAAAGLQPAHQRITQTGRAQTGVASKANPFTLMALQVGPEGAAELLDIGVQ